MLCCSALQWLSRRDAATSIFQGTFRQEDFSNSLIRRHALAQAESAEKHKLMTAFLLKQFVSYQEACAANGSHHAGYALASIEQHCFWQCVKDIMHD